MYFKILPTDKNYQNLNLLQKIVLLSAIDKDLFEKLDIAKSFVNQIKAYVNPELYMKLEQEKEHKEEDFIRKNSDFERVSQVGMATGKMIPSKITQYAIKKMYEKKKKREQVLYLKKDKEENGDIIG